MRITRISQTQVFLVLGLVALTGCGAEQPTYPFRGSWVDLDSPDLGLVLNADGTAVARGELPNDIACSKGRALWTGGSGHWVPDTGEQVLLYLDGDPENAIPVIAKTPFGSSDWTVVFVGVCGEASDGDSYVEMNGKTAEFSP